VLVLGPVVEPICKQLCAATGSTFLELSALTKAELATSSELGKEVAAAIKQGTVPAALSARIIKAAMAAGPGGTYLLAGFPDTADAHASFASEVGVTPSLALLFELPEVVARQQLAAAGVDPQAIEQKMSTGQQHTERIATSLDQQGLLRRVDANTTVDAAVATARGFIEQQDRAQSAVATGQPPSSEVRLVLVLGGPGVDTEDQCSRLASKFGCVSLSAGALMRAELDAQTATGVSIAEMVRSGKIVPAHMTIDMIRAATSKKPSKTYLVEGFPRTMDALGLFEKAFGACHRAIVFDIGDAQPTSETLKRQLRAFKSQTLPVVADLEGRGLVRKVQAAGDSDALFNAACRAYSSK